MSRQILVVTCASDVHADRVVEKIEEQGGDVFRLNLDAFPLDYLIDLSFDRGKWGGVICRLSDGAQLRIGAIGAVWLRKPADYRFVDAALGKQELAHASAETHQILMGLLNSLDCAWMSHPTALRGAMWKPEQLLRASQMGFATPASLATNCPERVDQFKRAAVGRRIVFKALSSPDLAAAEVKPADRVTSGILTTRITAEHNDLLQSVSQAPCFFQQDINKRYEVRVTVVGAQVFAVRIYSQDDARTAADFRDWSVKIRFEADKLPAVIEARCLELVRSYGLTFGALDLIVTPEGEYVFLENNPSGQFLFVEQLVPELRLTDAVADWLTRRADGSRGGENARPVA